ncbi:39S ribosomal protein L37, mitochondrial, partial [Cricetulus griseus]
GIKQALWLTKTKLIEGLPKKALSLVDDPRNHIENQEERVLDVISDARLWYCTEDIPKRETYFPVIVNSLNSCLNSTDLASSEGIENLVWIDSDQHLYQHFWCRPVIKNKVVVQLVPFHFQPETCRKFSALYLHGAV